MKTQLSSLLQKEMDRKDFLKHVGVGFAALMGVSAIAKAFTPPSRSAGYGSAVYGGKKAQV